MFFFIFSHLGGKKKKIELLLSWIFSSAAELPIAAWACASCPGAEDTTVACHPTLFCTPNVLYSTPATASTKSIVAGLKPNLAVGIVLGNITEFCA